jgi:hypothetical protein
LQPLDVYTHAKAAGKLSGQTEEPALLDVTEWLAREVPDDCSLSAFSGIVQRFTTHTAVSPVHAMAVGLLTVYLVDACRNKAGDDDKLHNGQPYLDIDLGIQFELDVRMSALKLAGSLQQQYWNKQELKLRQVSVASCAVLPFWIQTARGSASAWEFFAAVGGRAELALLLAQGAKCTFYVAWSNDECSRYTSDPSFSSELYNQRKRVERLMDRVSASLGDLHVDFCIPSCPDIQFRLVAGASELYLVASPGGIVYSPSSKDSAPRGTVSQRRVVGRVAEDILLPLVEDKSTLDVSRITKEHFNWTSKEKLQELVCTSGYVITQKNPTVWTPWAPYSLVQLNTLLTALELSPVPVPAPNNATHAADDGLDHLFDDLFNNGYGAGGAGLGSLEGGATSQAGHGVTSAASSAQGDDVTTTVTKIPRTVERISSAICSKQHI